MKTEKKRSECPISCALDVFGDKWSLLIIRDLIFNNKNTYGDFLKSSEGIATNILASRLQSLEENKIIEKLEHPKSKAKNLYRLSQMGIDLLPIMVEINIWSEKHLEIDENLKNQIKEIKKDKEVFLKSKTEELKMLIEN